MKALLIDTETRKASVVEIDDENHLKEFYRLLNCSLIDVAYRKVGGKYFDIIIDDEGLFTESPKVSALDTNREPALVGNLLLCNHDSDGNETSLSDDDIARIQEFIEYGFVENKRTGKVEPAIFLTGVDY